ncbi:hypothetical protein YYC_05137 [Plasmodium yoelii 17X]|uniref:Uncharacterized protein n=1 Tax=Plasmodium yoelii 17X TaxID=1323249 RepID=V7PCL9_PLAYE|nr:hypothetical protein YYC_05137 [Plasmodium yoelii 17X]
MKAFSILYKLNANKKNKNDEILFFCLYANKLYFYIGSTDGKIFVFKKNGSCFFDHIHFVSVIKSRTSAVITKVSILFCIFLIFSHFSSFFSFFSFFSFSQILIVDKLKLLIHGTSNGEIFLIKEYKLITKKEVKLKCVKENIFMLQNKYHKNTISSINVIVNEENQIIYLFIGDLDGILSCFILNKKLEIENEKDCILVIDKINGPINNIEISKNNILVTCEKYNTIISLEDILLKRENNKINNLKNIGTKENKNYYKSIFLNIKKKKKKMGIEY